MATCFHDQELISGKFVQMLYIAACGF